MPFELKSPTAVSLTHANLRAQREGTETVRAIDLKFCLERGNEVLDLFHPRLKECLFYRSAAEAEQIEIDDLEETLPNRIFPAMHPLQWDLEIKGADVAIDYGLGGDESDVSLTDCTVNKFVIDPREGGSVIVSFRVSTANIPDGALDKLSRLLNHQTMITLVCPEKLREQAVIDGTVGHPGLAKPKGKKADKDATDAFLEAEGFGHD